MKTTRSIRSKEIEEAIRQFLIREAEWQGPARKLTARFDLIGNGVVDSMGIHNLFAFLRTEFGIEIEDDELQLENFESIRRIGRLVVAKLAA